MRPVAGWPDLLGVVTQIWDVALNLGVRPRAVPGISSGFFATMPDFAFAPHFGRHPLAAAAGPSGGSRA